MTWVENDIIEKRGSFYRYDDKQLGQGREVSKQFLRDNNDLAREIDRLIREKAGLPPRSAAHNDDPEEPNNNAQKISRNDKKSNSTEKISVAA